MAADGVEREVKLRFSDGATARAAVLAAGATPARPRRLQQDALLDTADGYLRERQSALRVRVEGDKTTLTFKGPVQPSPMKMREEIETAAGDSRALFGVLDRLGFRVWFRYEKMREEFALDGCVVAVDETPAGTFVEIEGSEEGIARVARALERSPADYILDSYRELYVQRCRERGLPVSDMLFTSSEPS